MKSNVQSVRSTTKEVLCANVSLYDLLLVPYPMCALHSSQLLLIQSYLLSACMIVFRLPTYIIVWEKKGTYLNDRLLSIQDFCNQWLTWRPVLIPLFCFKYRRMSSIVSPCVKRKIQLVALIHSNKRKSFGLLIIHMNLALINMYKLNPVLLK